MSTIQSATGGTSAGEQLSALFTVPARASDAIGTSASSDASGSLESASTEDRFLKLLVAQMRNQDPLNPLDNAQVTSQLAQINTVRGIERLNETVAKLAAGSGMTSPIQAIGVIGRELLAEGDRIERGAATDGPVRAGFELASAADAVRVRIVDGAGETVYARDLGKTTAGMQLFEWSAVDAPAGVYRLKVEAVAGGQAVPVTPLTPARVLGVSQGSDGVQIELAGRASIAASAIKAIL